MTKEQRNSREVRRQLAADRRDLNADGLGDVFDCDLHQADGSFAGIDPSYWHRDEHRAEAMRERARRR